MKNWNSFGINLGKGERGKGGRNLNVEYGSFRFSFPILLSSYHIWEKANMGIKQIYT